MAMPKLSRMDILLEGHNDVYAASKTGSSWIISAALRFLFGASRTISSVRFLMCIPDIVFTDATVVSTLRFGISAAV